MQPGAVAAPDLQVHVPVEANAALGLPLPLVEAADLHPPLGAALACRVRAAGGVVVKDGLREAPATWSHVHTSRVAASCEGPRVLGAAYSSPERGTASAGSQNVASDVAEWLSSSRQSHLICATTSALQKSRYEVDA